MTYHGWWYTVSLISVLNSLGPILASYPNHNRWGDGSFQTHTWLQAQPQDQVFRALQKSSKARRRLFQGADRCYDFFRYLQAISQCFLSYIKHFVMITGSSGWNLYDLGLHATKSSGYNLKIVGSPSQLFQQPTSQTYFYTLEYKYKTLCNSPRIRLLILPFLKFDTAWKDLPYQLLHHNAFK